MNPIVEAVIDPLRYAFFQKGLGVAVLSGALLGFIGVYITLRGMSYIGHGLSHSIFGGFAASQLISARYYLWGAGVWGVLSAVSILAVTRRRRIGADAAIGVVTTASFALGVALLTRFGTTGPSFENALFGSILGISRGQLIALCLVAALTVAVVFLRYRALLFATFDPDVAQVSGVNVVATDVLLLTTLSLSLLTTLTVVGVTLVAAMLVIPPVTARMLSDSFARILLLSTLAGAAYGLVGMYLSYHAGVPSGTMIVLVGAAGFLVAAATRRRRPRPVGAAPTRTRRQAGRFANPPTRSPSRPHSSPSRW
ncbi:manganese/iron transport system permease protein/iron/zinc/copper transport system permease protein [Krasilnikovia cinnamomea]|uniref:Manganese/iron transport system permease protein/iron/zinc/copper transport system permease protein n=1 Tax=Krasilnikovia cinnamomea TaxID=349313 RepID=A0A4Q7ZT33_9ACTN|nr:metal ABC transporter permease [Krasilnikovia cinnamomea]RZU53655.1 manganese/iron transport system permease protein/iron/zinc/copper transport system permease protein [Krasilnikovia cinnamomea]